MLALISLSLVACDKRPDQWDAMIYRDAESVNPADETIRGFKSAELCRDAASDRLAQLGAEEAGTFACGHRCGPNDELGGMWACETVINAEDF